MVAADPGQVHPPSIPYDDGVKEALDQIQAMLRDPQAGGLVDDPQTAELLQKVGLTVADLYYDYEGAPMPAAAAAASSGERPPPAGAFEPDMGAGAGGEGAEGDFDEYGDDEEGEYDDGYGEPPAVQLRSGPQPVELWRAKHESAEPPRAPARKMRKEEWDRLVDRLNASSRRKKQYQGIMQAKREKEEMEGYRFRPTITRRSRALAEHLKSLPERMQALMHRRKAKIDKVKEEKAQRELAEATFRPNLNKPTRSRATEMQERMRRKVGHLLRYDLDKQMRAKQRRQIQQEVEDRELTFSPRINRRSTVLVQRMMQRKDAVERKVERQEQLTDDDYATLAGGRTRRAQERANAKTAAVSLATLEREMDLGRVKRVKLGPRGLTMLPGHEQETFHPRIDPRSRAVAQGKGKGRSVHDRLYLKATASMRQKRVASGQYFRQYINTDMDVSGGIDMGVTFQRDVARAQDEDEGEAAARAARAGRHRAVAEAPEKGYVNEVVYAQDFDAVVRLSIRAAEQAEAAAVADQEREEEERARAGVDGVDEGK